MCVQSPFDRIAKGLTRRDRAGKALETTRPDPLVLTRTWSRICIIHRESCIPFRFQKHRVRQKYIRIVTCRHAWPRIVRDAAGSSSRNIDVESTGQSTCSSATRDLRHFKSERPQLQVQTFVIQNLARFLTINQGIVTPV